MIAEAVTFMRTPMEDYYEILEIAPSASRSEIETAFERLITVYADDSAASYTLFGVEQAEEMRAKLRKARATLSDAQKRSQYHEQFGLSPLPTETETETVSDPMPAVPTEASAPAMIATSVDQPAMQHRAASVAEPVAASVAVTADTVSMQVASAPTPATQIDGPADRAVAEPATLLASAPSAAEPVESPETIVAVVASASAQPVIPAHVTGGDFSGGVLARARESIGMSIETVSKKTKISHVHLRAIEANQYDKLPSRVYVRGFVMQYARLLGLSAENVAASYLMLYDRFASQSK